MTDDGSDHERLQVQLAGCSVVALGGKVPNKDAYGWSPALQDVADLRGRHDRMEAALRRVRDIIDENHVIETSVVLGWIDAALQDTENEK